MSPGGPRSVRALSESCGNCALTTLAEGLQSARPGLKHRAEAADFRKGVVGERRSCGEAAVGTVVERDRVSPNLLRVSGHALRSRGCRAPGPSCGWLGGSYKIMW
jgi:hypothetical protein